MNVQTSADIMTFFLNNYLMHKINLLRITSMSRAKVCAQWTILYYPGSLLVSVLRRRIRCNSYFVLSGVFCVVFGILILVIYM